MSPIASSSGGKAARVSVTIDRLVLRGLDPAARTGFVEGLRRELAQVLADPATRADLQGSRRTPVLRLGQMPLEAGASGARSLGRSVARAIGNSGSVSRGVKR